MSSVSRVAFLGCAIGVLLMAGTVPGAMAGSQVVQQLTATSHAPRAHGQAKLSLKSPAKGRLLVGARKLAPRSSFDLVVGGVKVGSFKTNAAGRGKIKLSTHPKSGEGLLGVDPRGKMIEVRDGDGDDDLEGQMPGGGDSAAGAFACCVPGDDDGPECDVKTPDQCAAEGGMVQAGVSSCIPDPCAATPPVVCCLPGSSQGAFVDDNEQGDDNSQGDEPSQTGCAEVTTSQCATAGGTVVNATSCDPNPCAPVSPPQVSVCCVPNGSETECEVLTPDQCTAAHGTPNAAVSCDSHPCGGGSHGTGGEDGDGSSGPDSGDQGGGEG